MKYARVLWYVAIAVAILASVWAGIRSVGYYEAGQFTQFFVFVLLSLFCATFFIGLRPWLGVPRPSRPSNIQACPSCGYANLSTSNYCAQCGSPLRIGATVECNSCHRENQASSRYCQFCGHPLHPTEIRTTISPAPQQQLNKSRTCVSCGADVGVRWKFCAACGEPLIISVKEVLYSALRIVRAQPVIIVPILIELVASTLLARFLTPRLTLPPSATNPSSALVSIWGYLRRYLTVSTAFGLVVSPLVRGMYPSMVQNVLGANKINVTHALRGAGRKFLALFVSNVLIFLGTIIGYLLLVVPGLIITTWCYYTFPAIILEDRGALNGISASRAFARSRKWKTFLMLLIPLTPALVVEGFVLLFQRTTPLLTSTSPLIITSNIALSLVTGVLWEVTASYTYIRYAIPKSFTTTSLADGASSGDTTA